MLIRSGEARLVGRSRSMLYSGFVTLPRSVFWSADFNGRSDNADVIRLQIRHLHEELVRFGEKAPYGYTWYMIEPNQILEQALTLPENQRAAIAASLLQSLDSECDATSDADWDAEIKRRLDEIDNGSVELVPWREVKSKMQKIRNGL